ncbi:MAG: presenilin family intramembrane aspartyl protease PSH [Halobacteriota archaeon]
MHQRARVAMAVLGAATFFLVVQFGALALAEPFEAAGYQSVEDPQNPANSVLYFGVILVATVIMLGLMRYGRTTGLRVVLVLTSGLIAGYVFSVILPALTIPAFGEANISPWIGGAAIVAGLLFYPEWWVIDLSALIMGMGAAALFGISFGIFPALLLLVALAVYDAISVYGTKHMLTLASGVMELRVPVLVVLPTTLSYSFIDDAADMAESVGADEDETNRDSGGESDDSHTEEGGFDRDAIFIGLGDAVMPSILVASAAVFLETPTLLGIQVAPLGAIVGTMAGLFVLLKMVLEGRPHAGLPLLNGGAILGYLVAALATGTSLVTALGLDAVF